MYERLAAGAAQTPLSASGVKAEAMTACRSNARVLSFENRQHGSRSAGTGSSGGNGTGTSGDLCDGSLNGSDEGSNEPGSVPPADPPGRVGGTTIGKRSIMHTDAAEQGDQGCRSFSVVQPSHQNARSCHPSEHAVHAVDVGPHSMHAQQHQQQSAAAGQGLLLTQSTIAGGPYISPGGGHRHMEPHDGHATEHLQHKGKRARFDGHHDHVTAVSKVVAEGSGCLDPDNKDHEPTSRRSSGYVPSLGKWM